MAGLERGAPSPSSSRTVGAVRATMALSASEPARLEGEDWPTTGVLACGIRVRCGGRGRPETRTVPQDAATGALPRADKGDRPSAARAAGEAAEASAAAPRR